MVYYNQQQASIPRMMTPGTEIIPTMFGTFEIPNYALMTPQNYEMEYNSLVLRFTDLMELWKDVYKIEGPRPNENLRNMMVRYKENEQFLLSRNGSDLWFIGLVAGWSVVEWGLAESGFPADGYTASQIKMYKIYQQQMKRSGMVSAFGADWSPMTKSFVLAAGNALLLVMVSRLGGKQYAPMVMNELSKAICGNEATVEYTENGAPKPPTDNGLASIVSNLVPGNAMEMVASAGGIKGIFNLLTSFIPGANGGAAAKAPVVRTEEQKTTQKSRRRQGPSAD